MSTTKMRMNGTATFRSKPMNGTYTAARFSRTRMIHAATTAPIGLVSPPRMTAASAYTRVLSSIPGVSVSCGATSAPATAPSAAAHDPPHQPPLDHSAELEGEQDRQQDGEEEGHAAGRQPPRDVRREHGH